MNQMMSLRMDRHGAGGGVNHLAAPLVPARPLSITPGSIVDRSTDSKHPCDGSDDGSGAGDECSGGGGESLGSSLDEPSCLEPEDDGSSSVIAPDCTSRHPHKTNASKTSEAITTPRHLRIHPPSVSASMRMIPRSGSRGIWLQ
jgi:hypothetical protein